MSLLEKTLENIDQVNIDPNGEIRDHINKFAIPAYSLGRLEELAIIYVSITGDFKKTIKNKVIFTMAGDHGVAEEGVSAFPQEVTMQMVNNFLEKGAAVNILAQHVGAKIIVVDCGVKKDIKPGPNLKIKKIGYGTGNITKGPAMSLSDAEKSIEIGIETFNEELDNGIDIIGTGDMGIANTTPSSAIIAAFEGIDSESVTGRGTGIDDTVLSNKINVVKKALKVNKPDPTNPIDVLAKVGGYEIGAIAGLCLASARHKIPVVIDGFISTAGAYIACKLEPKIANYIIASHKSVEKGHTFSLEKMQKKPLLDLNMRLGEGTGSALGIFLVEAGMKLFTQMASFSKANVDTPCII
ncbi:MAG: nicotinate-nucleotide--dimethylbenzimidazole phosphoribosyltransferase [Candidatus Anammoxibacter sp.]